MPIQLGATNPGLLFIIGADQDEHIVQRGSKIRIRGSSDVYKLLGTGTPYHRIQIGPHTLRQTAKPNVSRYRRVVNLITEPEQNEQVLENLRKLLRQATGMVLNRPEAVLRSTRDQVARRLSGIPGLVVPRVVRIKPGKPDQAIQMVERAGLSFPIILRQAGTHTGRIVGLVDRIDDLRLQLVDGVDHLATEFFDFRSPDGLYRKHRVWFFGDRMVCRHLMISDHWNVHGKDAYRFMIDRPKLIEEERALLAEPEGAFSPAVKQVLQAIRQRMELDFFGTDFAITNDGQVLLFEANATMNFYAALPGPQFEYLQRVVPPARAAFRKLLGMERPQDMEFA
jgi:hypothetical protein